jgi:DNA recombination protein RmuC
VLSYVSWKAASGYELQVQLTPGSTERVDAVVHFPKTRLPIDSKFPREQVLPLFDATDPETLAAARQTLAQVIKAEARRIAKYLRPDSGTTDMALMFLPSETLYFEVIRDVALWSDLAKLKVFPVSPNTLAITLKGIAISYEYYEMAQNVEKTIEEIRKAQRHFGHFQRQFEEIGSRLEKAQQAFNTASTHLTRYSGAVVRLTGEPAAELPGTPGALPMPEDRPPAET